MSKFRFKFVIFLPFFFVYCSGERSTNNALFIPDFKWRVQVPEFLIYENKDEWKRVQDAGKDAIADTYNTELKNKLKTIFVFKSNDKSLFEAVSEPISKEQVANYNQICENMNNIFYNTIKTQVPTAQIDTTKGIEIVDNLEFKVLKAKLTFPNGSSKTTISYRRVFDNMELTITAMYGNQTSGDKIINAFMASTFDKRND